MDKDGANLVVLVDGKQQAGTMAIDEDYIYWEDAEGVKKVSKQGGGVVVLAERSDPEYMRDKHRLAVDDRFVYSTSCKAKSIWSVAKSGGSPSTILTGVCPQSLVPQGDYLYVADQDINDGRIVRIGKNGGELLELVTYETFGSTEMVIDGQNTYWIAKLEPSLQKQYAYLMDVIWGMPLRGGGPARLAIANIPDRLVVDERFVYWVDSDGLQKVSKQGGKVQSVTTLIGRPSNIVGDNNRLYFTIPVEQAVYAVDKN